MSDNRGPSQLRFGVNIGWMSRGEAAPVPAALAAEAAGYDIVTAADHVGSSSPFVVLAAAAAVTSRVRLRTYVLDHAFWNAGLLARDAATLDAVSGGRVELGLGAGHKPGEHDAVGLPFPPLAGRLDALGAFSDEVRRHLGSGTLSPRAVQDPIPVLMGAMSRRGLEVAVRHADVVALSGLLQAPARPPGTFTLASSAQTDERVGLVHDLRQRSGRPVTPLDVLVQQVVVDRDPEEVAAEFVADGDGLMTAADVLDSPFVLFAPTPEEAAKELLRRGERWGIGSWCVHQPSLAAMARVIEVLRP